MATSTRTRSAPLVRLRPEDLVRIVDEAKLLLAEKAAIYRDEQLAPQRKYRAYLEGISDADSIAQDLPDWEAREAAVDAHAQPHWWISVHKREGLDTSTGEAADIAPGLSMPRPNDYFSVRVVGGSSSIDIRFSILGAKITVMSDDDAWILNADLWSERQLREISPRYRWFGNPSAPFIMIYGGALTGALVALTLHLAGAAPIAVLAVLAAIALVGVAAGAVIRAVPGTVLSPTLGAKARGVRREVLWVIVGAVAGQVVSILWTAITG